MSTASEALRAAIPRLTAAGIDGAPRDARLLLAHAMGIAPDRLTLHLPDAIDAATAARFDAAIAARITRQPIAQIIGRRLFWGRSFTVTRDTLDPRPETELLVQTALGQPFARVLDLGTGSGCILCSLLADRADATGIGSDLSDAALAIAQQNADVLGVSDRARLVRSDWFAAIEGRFDLIVSNPPYIAEDELPNLAPDVRQWEPMAALTPGGDGLDAYRAIARATPAHLLPGGRLLLEIGPTQSAAVTDLLSAAGLIAITTLQDLDHRDRVISACKPQN